MWLDQDFWHLLFALPLLAVWWLLGASRDRLDAFLWPDGE